MRNYVLILVVSSMILQPVFLFAQSHVLTLDEAIQTVLSSNQDVQAAHYRSDAAKARIPQVKALDDPMVGVEFYNVPINTADVTKADDIDYKIEQKIPFPGKRHTRGKGAQFDAIAAAENANGRIGDILLDLKKTYYDIYRLNHSLEVNRENQGILKQFLGSTKTAYAAGKTTADAPLKAQVELSRMKNEELLMAQERVTHMAHLKALLNQHPNQHLDDGNDIQISSDIHWPRLKASLDEVESMAIQTRPELKELRAMESRDKAKLTSAKQGLIPDFAFGFAYKQKPGSVQDVWAGSAMINLPIFFWGKNRAEIREAKASLKATEAEHQSMELHTIHEIEQAYSAVQASEKLVASFQKEILPETKTTLNAARQAYSANSVDFLTLLDAARTYRDLQTSYYDNQAKLGMNFAELERLVGKSLGNERR